MAIVKLWYHLLHIAIVAKSYKYYCHFYDEYLQSVCLQTRTSNGLYGISKNTVFFWWDEPNRPIYKTEEMPIRIRQHNNEGVWSFPDSISLPWAVDYNNITYTKVDGKGDTTGHYDVKFTPQSPARRFDKLEPISVDDMRIAEGINDTNGTLCYSTDLYFSTTATVRWERSSQSILARGWKAIQALSSASTAGFRKLAYGDVTRLSSTKVRQLEARSEYNFYSAEAFVFKFPPPRVQHGVMFCANNNALMLYRDDQVQLRMHDTLPPEFGKERPSRSAGPVLPPSYQEATSQGVLPRYNSIYPDEAPPDYSATPVQDGGSTQQGEDRPPPYSE